MDEKKETGVGDPGEDSEVKVNFQGGRPWKLGDRVQGSEFRGLEDL